MRRFPERIKAAIIARAAKIEYPIAAVIEMAIGSSISAAGAIRAALIRSGKRLKMTSASAGESYS